MSIRKKGKFKHHLALTTFKNEKIGKRWTSLTGNLPANTIGPDIQYINGKYYLFCKNEQVRKLVMGTANKITGPYKVTQIKLAFDTYNTQKDGITVFHGLHYVKRNINSNNWSRMQQIKGPIVTRHGQIILNK